jgi:hypothetical protein
MKDIHADKTDISHHFVFSFILLPADSSCRFSIKDDVVIDDFMFKKMGNGEVFYGKKKVNPSGH